MQFIPTLIPYPRFINEPGDLAGWVGWGLLLFFILWLTNQWKVRVFEQFPNRKVFFIFLFLITPITTLFFGFQLNNGLVVGSGVEISRSAVFFCLAALPWILAAGLIGIIPAMLLAGISGLLQAMFQTHSLFTPLNLILLALLFGNILRQNYRTDFFTFLRHPLPAAGFCAVLFFPCVIVFSFLSTRGALPTRLDWSLTQTWPAFLILLFEMVIAGGIAEFIYHRRKEIWFIPDSLVPSPIEKSLKLQFLIATVPFLIAILLSLCISIWVMAKNVSLQIIREDLLNEAETITTDIPSLIDTGQRNIDTLNSTDLLSFSQAKFEKYIQENAKDPPFFSEIILVDEKGSILASYSSNEQDASGLTDEETQNASEMLNGIKPVISVAPRKDGDVQVTFMSALEEEGGTIRGVLIGRTQFALNQRLKKLFAAMNTFERETGNIVLLNGGLQSLEQYHPDLKITDYESWSTDGTGFFVWSNSQGEDSLNYYQPIPDSDWSLVLNVPFTQINQKTSFIAFPLLFINSILITGAILGLLLSLNRVSGSLKTLNLETDRIAKGDLRAATQSGGVDEVGKLGQSFEEMRTSLRSRLEELNHLVQVSKGVASSLDIEKSLQGVLDAAIQTRASSARIVLIPAVTLKVYPDGFFVLKTGTLTDVYTYFDRPLFEYMKHQDFLVLPKPSRMRRLDIPEDRPTPSALIARTLRSDDVYYGVLWIGYEQSREFTEEEIQFINMLGDQASLAASNAALYSSTEIVRQRLEAVLASTPEPILVFDENDQLLLLNPAARDMSGLVLDTSLGNSLEETLAEKDLVNLIRKQEGFQTLQKEIRLRGQRIFQANITPVYAQGSMIGKTCILQEITEYKKLDAQKSEFVTTVSHELRSPLSMLKGYITMLPMLGEMNDQQRDYLKMINTGIDSMTHLVNNLLDLGRIDAGVGIKRESIQPAPVIERVLKALTPEANHKSILLEAVLPEDPERNIIADAALLQQAIFNLVDNAIHFTNVGGRVDVGYRWDEAKTSFFVKDSGIGISPIDLPGIFNQEKPSRVEKGKVNQNQEMVKLGLSIVKSIAEKHHGSVRVESQLGKGSTFYLEIPNPDLDSK